MSSSNAKQEVWFLTGSQELYGQETLDQVAQHSRQIAHYLDTEARLPVRVVHKPTLKSPDAIAQMCREANSAADCVGVIAWMHTFSPAKMWIRGLTQLTKPLAHLHTQFNRELPWAQIDMDFMNLNQSAHGDREFGFVAARLRLERKIVVGHWQDSDVAAELQSWARVCNALAESRQLKIVRFGGMNMREVAVTGGDRVEAEIQFGWSVNGHAVGDLVERITAVRDAEVDQLVEEYESKYKLVPALQRGGSKREGLRYAARQELGIRAFLTSGGYGAFTTTFEDLYGMNQLPGLACQRLMADGYGFGAEGDWKTAALVRLMKIIGAGRAGGVSFMEDYTYHLVKGEEKVLGAHMLEVCPSIADGTPSLEVHPLGIGGKEDPCRLVFNAAPGAAVAAALVDMGGRMRMLVHELDAIVAEHAMPNLPVARALWVPRPDFRRGCQAWLLAGGGHHTAFSQAVTADQLEDLAGLLGVECVRIGYGTELSALKKELRWNESAFGNRH
ncbi:MAG TPA: L-arabinose isomerase [Polyangiaceae bacterium]|nr:L-arabinose isomerase [Polyangiaceae bacterium]